jgi:DNA polymerase III subunit beta
VKLALSHDLLVLSASSPEAGVATEELDSDSVQYQAEPLEIGFQARYLNDITDQIAERVEFRFSDGSAPTVVVDGADESALYVLMPMRV